jgi:ribonucleoside-diphosphate reductase alpha chain
MRAPLPNRRLAERLKFEHRNIRYYATLGYDPSDGSAPLEIFLSAGKIGSGIEAIARDTAVFASLALQHGCPLETLRNAVTRLDDGTAAGPGGRLLDIISGGK